MNQALNPYSPGAGIERARRGLHNRGIVMHGLRGVGKTVLLNEMSARAEAADWLVVQIEAARDEVGKRRVRSKLARELAVGVRKRSPWRKWAHLKEALPVIASFSLGLGGVSLDVEPQRGRGDSGDIGIDLEELVLDVAESAKKDEKGIGFFVDEMQDIDKELLSAIISV